MSNTSNGSILWGYSAAVISAICFSAKGIIIKFGFAEGVIITDLIALRYAFSMPFFILIFLKSSHNRLHSASNPIVLKDWLYVAGFALLGYFFASIFDFLGLKYISVGLERLILYIHPSLVILLLLALGRSQMDLRTVIALGLGYLGLFFCYWGEIHIHSPIDALKGSLWVLASAGSYACFLVFSERLIPRIGAQRFTSSGMIIAGFIAYIQVGFTSDSHLFDYSVKVYGIALLLAIVGTVVPIVLFAIAYQKIGPAKLSIAGMVGPASTLLLASLILGEPSGLWQWLGFVLTLVGGLLLIAKNLFF